MLVSAFEIKLGHEIRSGMVTFGKFDGKSPSLACATSGGKILLHSPHDKSLGSDGKGVPSIRFLNFNRNVTALSAGILTGTLNDQNCTSIDRDLLFVGTQTNILAYDIEKNSDMFFREVQDGVHVLVLGKINPLNMAPLLISGGNCSVLGFDGDGKESFWTVTGDNVSALAFCDINKDGFKELLVGSEDFMIRIFHQEVLIDEISEADKVIFLKPIHDAVFAYGLANGTVGVYNGKTRLWRVKTKHRVTALDAYDANMDGVPEVIIGWNNGNFQVRKVEDGEIIFKDKLSSAVAGIVICDYRLDGKEEIIVCLESGDVKAYLPADAEIAAMAENVAERANLEDQKAIAELQLLKSVMSNEIRSIDRIVKATRGGESAVGSLSAGTTLQFALIPDLEAHAVCLQITISTEVLIVNIIVIDHESGILDGCEILAIAPMINGKSTSLPLRPAKHSACKIKIQTHLAARGLSHQLHVFENEVKIPKFSSFLRIDESSSSTGGKGSFEESNSKVTFSLSGVSLSRLVEYLNSAFIVPDTIKYLDSLRIKFVGVCDVPSNNSAQNNSNNTQDRDRVLSISAKLDPSNPSGIQVRIRCNKMDLAAEIIQDMGKYLKINDLESEVDFPDELAAFDEVVNRVDDYSSTRIRLTADMADDSQHVKALIVRAEDSRLLTDMKTMRRAYSELYGLNNQLISSYSLRTQNHLGLMAALKDVNLMIQKAANLRLGRPKSSLVADCRAAVKTNNMASLLRIIKNGYDNHSRAASDKR